MKRKAQLSAMFNWVFILIAGTIILTFFITIALKQKDVAEQKLSMTIISELEGIMAGVGAGEEESFHKIEIPKTGITFICAENGYSEYAIEKTGFHTDIPITPIFAPELVQGPNLQAWTLPWSIPFKADNFVMITSQLIKYVIVYDPLDTISSNLKDQVEFDLPDALTKQFVTVNGLNAELLDTNNYKIKFIFLTPNIPSSLPTFISDMDNKDVSAISIEDFSSDKIIFYKKIGNHFDAGEQVHFAGNEMFSDKDPAFYAAFFAETAEYYKCSLQKAYKRLYFVSQIQKSKVEKLEFYHGLLENQPSACLGLYHPVEYDALINSANTCSKSITRNCISTASSTAVVLETRNNILLGEDPICQMY